MACMGERVPGVSGFEPPVCDACSRARSGCRGNGDPGSWLASWKKGCGGLAAPRSWSRDRQPSFPRASHLSPTSSERMVGSGTGVGYRL